MRELRREVLTLYLDFDGVLHRLGEEALDDAFQLLPNPILFCWRPILVELLRPWPEVQIIVSSDWRALFNDERLIEMLGPELGARFVGVVEIRYRARAEEVLEDAAARGVVKWICLDDHQSVREMETVDPRFISCQPTAGISDIQVQLRLRQALKRGQDE